MSKIQFNSNYLNKRDNAVLSAGHLGLFLKQGVKHGTTRPSTQMTPWITSKKKKGKPSDGKSPY